MIATFKRIPRPVAFWLAGMSIGSVSAFVFVHILVSTFLPVVAYNQPILFLDLVLSFALCALAFTLADLAFRLYLAGYNSIPP